ncbi:hypothetical protein RJ639_043977 [Escallonia herrerae]|uniref:Mitogen-activated protein kinase kinase kinase 1 n=1 Tax=Escallonia herrerae TaxID=1293975 RepID=A0AA88WBR3_9ASTE|nr:hypothetical protein RJ639_043977 [Escallonia herrerae]
MESVGSNSPSSSPPDSHHQHDHHRPYYRFNPTQPLTDRVLRALGHRLRLLHRADSNFFVLGATGNVYTVTLSSTPSCTCPDRTTPCKHILFVYIRVLGISLDDGCLWRKSLRPCQLSRLLAMPMLTEYLAGANAREWFHHLFFRERQQEKSIGVEDGATCPICLEEMGGGEKLVACGTCRNAIHEECLLAWKRSNRRRSTSCVMCRARWRDIADQERYLNLSVYVGQDDTADGYGGCGG